jgi:hypothetical protein
MKKTFRLVSIALAAAVFGFVGFKMFSPAEDLGEGAGPRDEDGGGSCGAG